MAAAVWYHLSRQLAALPKCLLGRWEQEQHMYRTEADSRDELSACSKIPVLLNKAGFVTD